MNKLMLINTGLVEAYMHEIIISQTSKGIVDTCTHAAEMVGVFREGDRCRR